MYFLTFVASLVNNVDDGGSGVAIASGDSFAILIVSAWVEIGGGVATVSACVNNFEIGGGVAIVSACVEMGGCGWGVAIASGDSFAILIVSAWVEIGGGVATVSACVENEGTCVAIAMVSASDCDDLASLLGCLLARCLLSVCLLSGCLLWYPQQPAERYQYLCLALNALTE